MKNIILEFLHPGKEFDLKSNIPMSIRNIHNDLPKQGTKGYVYPLNEDNTLGVRLWNQLKSGHKRKYLISNGKYIEHFDDFSELSNLPKEAEEGCITFWGEWEPQSFFSKINSNNPSAPKHLHYPFFIDFDNFTGTGCQTTDPFVFHNFYYTHCLQGYNSLGRPKPLHKYLTNENLSMILFGYEYAPKGTITDFILDTVIVIDKNKTINKPSYIFEQSNFKHTNDEHSRYIGKKFEQNNNSIFSFSPCKPVKNGILNRMEVSIPINIFNLKPPGSRQGGRDLCDPKNKSKNDKNIYFCSDENLKEFWVKLVKHLFDNNISIAVHIDEPLQFDNYNKAFRYYQDEAKCKISQLIQH